MRTEPPFRADHVGSLLRPATLLQARDDYAKGALDAAGLRVIEDAAIRDVVELQKEAGLQTATDGEFRRASWHMDFIYRLGGISVAADEQIVVKFRNDTEKIEFTPKGMKVDGKITLNETIFGDDFAYLQSVAGEGQTPKLTIPSPNMVHYRGGQAALDPAVYPDIEEFWTDLAAAYQTEGGPDRRAGLHLPAVRRHLARLPQRPGAARGDRRPRRRRRPPAPALHPADQRRHRRQARGHADHHPHVPRQLPLVLGGRGLPTTSSPRPCSANSASTASSWSSTTSGRAASNRCGTCPRASTSSSASSPPSRASWSPKDDLKRRVEAAVEVHRRRPALPVPAVRVLFHRGGQRPHPGGAVRQAASDRGDRTGDLGLERRSGVSDRWAYRPSIWAKRLSAPLRRPICSAS